MQRSPHGEMKKEEIPLMIIKQLPNQSIPQCAQLPIPLYKNMRCTSRPTTCPFNYVVLLLKPVIRYLHIVYCVLVKQTNQTVLSSWSRSDTYISIVLYRLRLEAAIICPKLEAVNRSFLAAAQREFSLCPVVMKAIWVIFCWDRTSDRLKYVLGSCDERYPGLTNTSSISGNGSCGGLGSSNRIQCKATILFGSPVFLVGGCLLYARRYNTWTIPVAEHVASHGKLLTQVQYEDNHSSRTSLVANTVASHGRLLTQVQYEDNHSSRTSLVANTEVFETSILNLAKVRLVVHRGGK
ncbi:hypothetical protein MAR_017825 [Mya arenaria]|uniref:Uncharacterized protein n=1 Tax=Mya arenaria TaxID=6604 RepID=A0ABY7ECX6_MYAAR|nr:hypothetical protein MAR_017825 [Mya arenaria]